MAAEEQCNAEKTTPITTTTNVGDGAQLQLQHQHQSFTQHGHSNAHRVVPIGVLAVLFTLYLTTTALQRNYCQQQSVGARVGEGLTYMWNTALEEEKSNYQQEESQRVRLIKEKLLEHEDVCFDLEIFTAIYEQATEQMSMSYELAAEDFVEVEEVTRNVRPRRNGINVKKIAPLRRQLKRMSMNSHRSSNGNKSAVKHAKSTKNGNGSKQEQPKEQKKSSTAEPIIYLFALVFIYLLLKAASDINQHYKAQSKGDKRLRRCSLQSYAQTHKQDRRASKDSPLRQRQRLLECRSLSVDRCGHEDISEYATKKAQILANLRKQTSVEGCSTLHQQQHMTHKQPLPAWPYALVENTDLSRITTSGSTEMLTSPTRRCSVPYFSHHQKQKFNSIPPVPLCNTSRRTSIAFGNVITGTNSGNLDLADVQLPESRRRVRMINRH